MNCPNCGGDCYDNRQRKAEGKMKPNAPDAACKDKDGCGWKLWPPKGQRPQGTWPSKNSDNGAPRAGQPQPTREPWTWGDLFTAYESCFKRVATVQGEKATPDSLNAGVATLLIAAGSHNLPGPVTAKKRAEAIKAAEDAARKQREEAQRQVVDDEDSYPPGETDLPY